ncbi:hypothetical protein JNUCC31_14020 [Paenibacillus sp. JNUCC31]|uniref:hypothetical protein n=1 Tax=Paenibacillus sp. JNUCC-31 TaxID=2777983 RepID=UPI0017876DC4|nr:hypothetical protein JNUCC31_14020 [Paenibacillus sp. JNUCC-31]
MITKPCTITEIQHLSSEYLEELSSPFDSFLEEHILSSTFSCFRTIRTMWVTWLYITMNFLQNPRTRKPNSLDVG